jgi:hypothetical protein
MNRRKFILSVSSSMLFYLFYKYLPLINLNTLNDLSKYTLKELGGYKMSDLYGVKINGSKMMNQNQEEKHRWFFPWLWR